MLNISAQQQFSMSQQMLFRKLGSFLGRTLDDFHVLGAEGQAAYISTCMATAQRLGLASESGVASYALAVWWLGFDFEEQSPLLQRLVRTALPLARKVHAMNEWVHARLLSPNDARPADDALRTALMHTKAWGTR